VSLHEDMLQEVNNVFVNQPSDQIGGDLNPPRPLGYWITNGASKHATITSK